MNSRVHRLGIGSPGRRVCFLGVFFLEVLVVCVGPAFRADGAEKDSELGALDRVRSTLFGADMVRPHVEGHDAFILLPGTPKADRTKPWVWYAPTLLADREGDWVSPGKRHGWIFRRLLAAGVYVAGVDVGESYGSPAGRVIYDRFYDLLVNDYGFSTKPGLLPISRGGMMAYNWAADRPDRVRCIGGIYPLCNLAAYPRLNRIAKAYGMTVEELRAQMAQHNPIDRLRPLAEARIPILHLHGDQDTAVPVTAHSAELARRYQALGGGAEVIVIHGKGHEVVPEYWEEPRLIEFFLKHVLPP